MALVIWGALLALAARTTLWDRDEPRFAQATVEMMRTGDYLVPTLNGRLRPDKPILVYWLMSLPIRWLGPTALAARSWSAAAIGLTALLTFGVGRRLVGGPAGGWAMAILAATPLALIEGQAATADAILLAAVTAALACFVAALLRNGGGGDAEGAGTGGADRSTWGAADSWKLWPWLGLGAAVGLALLAKGPVGLAVPGLGVAVTLWLLRQPSAMAGAAGDGPEAAEPPGRARRSLLGSGALAWRAALAGLLGIALFCAWGIPANHASGGELARLGLGRHVLGRALGAMEGHGGGGPLAGILYYLLVLALGFAPWSLYLPAAISAVLGGRIGGELGRALLIGWTAPALLLMAVVATRLPNYILPVWPALALAVGGTLDAERCGRLAARDRRWLRRGGWLLFGLLVLVAGGAVALAAVVLDGRWLTSAMGPMAAGAPGAPSGLGAAGTPGVLCALGTPGASGSLGSLGATGALGAAEMARDLLPAALALAIVVLAAGGAALREHLAGRYRRGAAILLGGVVGAAWVAGAWTAPALERWKPAPRLAAAVRAAAAPGLPIVTYGYGEPSVTFYLQRGIVNELGDPAALAAWCGERAPGILILPRSALHDLRALPGSASLREIAAASGFNIAKGRFQELVALERDGPGPPGTDPGPHRKPDNPG